MKKFFSSMKKRALVTAAVATTAANAAAVDIDTTEITASVSNIGGKAIALVLLVAGFYVSYRIIKSMIK